MNGGESVCAGVGIDSNNEFEFLGDDCHRAFSFY
jgi:hypothetical protein